MFRSPRLFYAAALTPGGHGSLLLRSRKETEFPKRMDIAIRGVRALEIRFYFRGIHIEEVGSEYLKNFRSRPLEMLENGVRIYAFHGAGWDGFVIGGVFLQGEDDGEYADPSPIAL